MIVHEKGREQKIFLESLPIPFSLLKGSKSGIAKVVFQNLMGGV
jgi:hypothetical protein